MKRYGWVIKVRSDKIAEYENLHSNIWPEVAKGIKESHVQNYSIYYRDGFLFSYLEYIGSDFEKDMANLSAKPVMQQWREICKTFQQPVETAKQDEWWVDMKEVFHLD
jgi:L-rhamnose mutarotase